VQPRPVGTRSRPSRPTTPRPADAARPGKRHKSQPPRSGGVCLVTKGGLIRVMQNNRLYAGISTCKVLIQARAICVWKRISPAWYLYGMSVTGMLNTTPPTEPDSACSSNRRSKFTQSVRLNPQICPKEASSSSLLNSSIGCVRRTVPSETTYIKCPQFAKKCWLRSMIPIHP